MITPPKSASAATAPATPPARAPFKISHGYQQFRGLLGHRLEPSLAHGGKAPALSGALGGFPGLPPASRPADGPATNTGGTGGGAQGEAPPPGADPLPLIDPFEVVFAVPKGAQHSACDTPRADYATAVEEVVRRISWGGDRRSGTARIELGGGPLKGAVIVVHANEARRVAIELELPPGLDATGLAQRLRQRLAGRGIDLSALTLT